MEDLKKINDIRSSIDKSQMSEVLEEQKTSELGLNKQESMAHQAKKWTHMYDADYKLIVDPQVYPIELF
jgi:hypothetical protein